MGDWTIGYTQSELDAAQKKFGLRFPRDLAELLRERRPLAGYDWRVDEDAIRKALRWPLEGIQFDVEEDDFWLPQWGYRPASGEERTKVVAAAVAAAPRLIPIMGHRYIPEEPHERGNPLFSVYQTDVIYYGADLDDYFCREFAPVQWEGGAVEPKKRIRFWSDLAE